MRPEDAGPVPDCGVCLEVMGKSPADTVTSRVRPPTSASRTARSSWKASFLAWEGEEGEKRVCLARSTERSKGSLRERLFEDDGDVGAGSWDGRWRLVEGRSGGPTDRKSTRLNSSHSSI